MPEAATKQSPAFSCPFSAGAHAEKGHIYFQPRFAERRKHFMAFFNSAVGVLQTLVIALGAGLGIRIRDHPYSGADSDIHSLL